MLAWSFCLSRIFLLITVSPCPGRDFISFQTRKETKQRNAFKPRIPKCRRCSLQVFGTNVVPPSPINAQLNTRLKHTRHAHASPRRPYISNYSDSSTTTPAVGPRLVARRRALRSPDQSNHEIKWLFACLTAGATGYRLLVAGCRLPVAGCRLPVAGCRLPQ